MMVSLLLQGCTGLLEKAKKLVSRVEDRYMLFVCEQVKLERMSNDNTAETSMDMVRSQNHGACRCVATLQKSTTSITCSTTSFPAACKSCLQLCIVCGIMR